MNYIIFKKEFSSIFFALIFFSLFFSTASYSKNNKTTNTDSGISKDGSVSWFSSGGQTAYHVRAAHTNSNINRSVIAAMYSGKIICFSYDGKKLWEQSAGKSFPFDLDAGDIDGDGFDECVIASADGSLYIIDHDGTLIKRVFENKPPLYSVKIISHGNNKKGIVCGGIERILYHISSNGEIKNTSEVKNAVIRSIDVGHFQSKDSLSLVVGLFYDLQKAHYNIYSIPDLVQIGNQVDTKEEFLYKAVTVDAEGDGIDEIAMGANGLKLSNGSSIFKTDGTRVCKFETVEPGNGQNLFYMVLFDKIPQKQGTGDQIISISANAFRYFDTKGKIIKNIEIAFAPTDLKYDQKTGVLLLGNEQSGGDCIFLVRLNQPGWEKSLASLGFMGKLKTIVKNMETLSKQIDAFEKPSYQKLDNPEVVGYHRGQADLSNIVAQMDSNQVKDKGESVLHILNKFYNSHFKYKNIRFASNQFVLEKYDRSKQLHGWDKPVTAEDITTLLRCRLLITLLEWNVIVYPLSGLSVMAMILFLFN